MYYNITNMTYEILSFLSPAHQPVQITPDDQVGGSATQKV